MNEPQFDHLSRFLGRLTNRRTLNRMLAALPLLGAGSLLAKEAGAAQEQCPDSSAVWTTEAMFSVDPTGDGRVHPTGGLATSPDGLTVWIIHSMTDEISVWTRPHAESTDWTNQVSFGDSNVMLPRSLASSRDSLTIWVAEPGNHRISTWTRPNSTSTQWSNESSFGSEGRRVQQFSSPTDVVVSPDELTIWVADGGSNHRISVWTRTDKMSKFTSETTFGSYGDGADQLMIPTSIAVSPNGLTVWVADGDNDRISVWTREHSDSTDWAPQTTFGRNGTDVGQFDFPIGIAASLDGLTVWVADSGNDRISIWTRPDASSTNWSNITTFGNGVLDRGKLNSPVDITVSADNLTVWVSDSDNERVSVWSLTCPA